jgi:hypothetical protein
LEHWETVEADFQRFYQVDLRTLGCRRIRAFLRGLPHDSGTSRTLDPQAAMWSPEVEWMVRAIEYQDRFTWRICAVVWKALTGKDMKEPEMLTIPRPNDPVPQRGVNRRAFMKLIKGSASFVPNSEGGET